MSLWDAVIVWKAIEFVIFSLKYDGNHLVYGSFWFLYIALVILLSMVKNDEEW